MHTLIAGRLRWHIFRGYGVCCSPGATQGSRWRSTRSTLRRRAPLAKPGVQNRNTHGVRAVANSQMESVVTSHGDGDGDGDGEFLQFFCSWIRASALL